LVKQSFDLHEEPDLPVGLLVSAKERLVSDQLHEGIINLATSCEIAAIRYIERKCMSRDSQVKAILNLKREHSFAERHFHLVPSHIDRRSLKMDDADAFSLLEKTYLTRNKLAHNGELAYKDPASHKKIVVTRPMTIDFFIGCERALDWINKL
jgi:hypothetical protein